MIAHWDLIPGEEVTLTSPTGIEKDAIFLSRDTLHVCFQLHRQKNEVTRLWLRFDDDDPRMRDALGRHWSVKGQRETTRGELGQQPMRAKEDRWKNTRENKLARGFGS